MWPPSIVRRPRGRPHGVAPTWRLRVLWRHEDVEQGRAALRKGGQRAFDRGLEGGRLLHALAGAAVGLGELRVVRCRREDVADQLAGPHGRAVAKILVDVPGLRCVAAVVADDDEDGRAVLLREAERRRNGIVVEGAVADDAHDGVAGPGQLDAERRAQAGAERAGPAAILPERLGLEEELGHLGYLGDDLVDDARGR